MSTGEPDECTCGRTISGGCGCPIHNLFQQIGVFKCDGCGYEGAMTQLTLQSHANCKKEKMTECICYGTDFSGISICGVPCPVHGKKKKIPTDGIRKFMTHEQEAEFRLLVRQAYRSEGLVGLFQMVGEMVASIAVVNEMIGEIIEEKEKGKQD